MGCCQTRDKGREGQSISKGLALNDQEKVLVKNYLDLDLVLKYLESLDHQTGWNLLISNNDIVVECLDESLFTSQVPVLMGWTYLEFNVPVMVLEQLILYDRSWDLRVESVEFIETQQAFKILKIVQKYELKKLVFFVKVFRIEKNGVLNILTVNECRQDYQEEQLELGWHHFSLIRVKKLAEKVLISHLFQIDRNFESENTLNYVLGNELFDWLFRIKQKASEVYKKIC